jgi:HSP20 family protein
MGGEIQAGLVGTPEVVELRSEDLFFELAQEINNLIARRAYELYEAGGWTPGRDREDWFRAESEILLRVPVEVSETENSFTVRAEVTGFSEKDIEVRVTDRSLCIRGRRDAAWPPMEGRAIYSERRPIQVFRVLNLPVPVLADSVNAGLSDGVLEITLAKIETGKKVPVLIQATAA